MKEKSFFQFSLGQIFFVSAATVALVIVAFYIGARFGPKIFWGIEISKSTKEALLPHEISTEELDALMKDEGQLALTFYDKLDQNKSATGDVKLTGLDEKKVEDAIKEDIAKKVEASEKPLVADKNEKTELKPNKDEVKSTTVQATKTEVALKKEAATQTELKPVTANITAVPKPQLQEKSKPVVAVLPSVSHTEPVTAPKSETTHLDSLIAEHLEEPKPVIDAPTPIADTASGSYSLQIGNLSDVKKAEKLEQRLSAAGYTVVRRTFQNASGQKVYALDVGHYSSKEAAQKTQASIRNKFMVIPQIVGH